MSRHLDNTAVLSTLYKNRHKFLRFILLITIFFCVYFFHDPISFILSIIGIRYWCYKG